MGIKTPTVHQDQTPVHLRANRGAVSRWLGRTVLSILGWRVEGQIPDLKRLLVIGAPHTSNWDGVFGFAAILGLDAKITFFGKHSLFTQPLLGRFLAYMGGIPVDKTKPGSGLTDVVIENMAQLNGSLIVISPEGTRAKTERLKSGFLRIADAVEGKVFLAAFDFGKKRIVLDSFLDRSKDYEQDIAYVTAYYTNFEGKCPENY